MVGGGLPGWFWGCLGVLHICVGCCVGVPAGAAGGRVSGSLGLGEMGRGGQANAVRSRWNPWAIWVANFRV